jgi:putative acetyltransferase
MQPLRQLSTADLSELTAVYRDAVLSQAPALYSPEQVIAWGTHAEHTDAVRTPLAEGYGLGSICRTPAESGLIRDSIEAFGILHPPDRLALLYCRGRSTRQGRASAIVRALEQRARSSGLAQLRTEASQLSRPLLERLGWMVEARETVLFAGEWFSRWRMIRTLHSLTPDATGTLPRG